MDKKHMVNYFEQILYPIKSMFNTVVNRELLIKFVKDTYCILAEDNVYLYKPQSEFLKDFDKDNNIFDKSNIQNNTNSNNSISVQETCNQYGIVYDKSINLFKNAYNTDNKDIIFKRKHFETFYVIPAIYADEFIIKIFYHSYLMLFKTLNENMEKDKIILQNKDKQNVEQQDKYIPTPAFNKFCYNVLRSITYEPIAIPLVSLFFSEPRVFSEYKDVRLYINSYITNIHHFGHEKVSYNKIYKNNHFFLWLMFRCVISTTYDYTSHDQYFRFKEAALFGISHNKDVSNIENIFKVCVDIFSILNLKQAQLLYNEKKDDVYRAYSDIKINTYPYSKIIFSDEMKEYLIKVIPNDNTTEGSTNNNNSIILDSMPLTEIYKFFRDTFQKFYNIEPINYMYIFATDNPNRRNFWKGVRRYNQPIKSNKTKLLFIKVSEYIQVRFWDLIYKDNNTKYIIILYTDDSIPYYHYIINCRDMPVNNKIGNNPDKFTFYWYDKIGDKIVKLSNKYNIDTKASAGADGGYICTYEKDEKDENNKEDENLGGVYYPGFHRFHIAYKQYTFEFLNYLVEKEQSCIAGIQLRAPITATNVVSTVSYGAMKVDIYITAQKNGYILPYELTNCVCYLYVCDTDEIIEGTISVIRDGNEDIEFLTTFSFMPKRRYTDLVCKLSLSLKDFENIHQSNSTNCLSVTLNYNNIILQYYNNKCTWNIGNLPVVYKIKQACFMRGYDFSDENNQKIQLKVNIDKKGKDVSNVKVASYIIWFGGEKNIDNDSDPSNIKILKGKDNNLLIGDEIEYILPKEWTREELYNNPNKYIVFFPYIIQHDKLKKLQNDNTKLPTFTSEDYKYHTAFKTSRNKLSVEAVKLINDDKNIDKIELQAIYNYPFDKKISETKWHIMVHDATSPIYVDGKPIVGHNYEMVFNNLDQVSAANIAEVKAVEDAIVKVKRDAFIKAIDKAVSKVNTGANAKVIEEAIAKAKQDTQETTDTKTFNAIKGAITNLSNKAQDNEKAEFDVVAKAIDNAKNEVKVTLKVIDDAIEKVNKGTYAEIIEEEISSARKKAQESTQAPEQANAVTPEEIETKTINAIEDAIRTLRESLINLYKQERTKQNNTAEIYNIEFDKNDFNVNTLYLFEKKGEKITFPYDSMFLDKKLIFFASMRKVISSISASYMFTQPITLIFDGETLKIYENGLELDGYDARSGVADSQRNKTDGNKTEYVKEVAYPSVKSNNDDSNTVDNSSKFFYYDEKNTTKIPEGEYYILVDEPSKSSSTDNAGTQSNEIIVGEPSKFQDKLGERYIEIYKLSALLFSSEDSFNQSINKRKAETKENFGWFGNKTSYLIHGGKNYEDENGIDLSSNVTTFCKNLATLVSDTYKDKLYKVYGKVPIKLKVEYSNRLILQILRLCEFRPANLSSEYWATIGRFELRKGNKIMKNIDGKEIKGYMIEPASFNKNSDVQAEYQQITEATDTCVPTGQYKIFWKESPQFYFKLNNYKQLEELINSLGIKTTGGRVKIMPEIYNEEYGISADTKIHGNNGQNRSLILIHSGNNGKDSTGCLLPNEKLKSSISNETGLIACSSHPMLTSLFDAIITHDPYAFKKYGNKVFVNNFFINIFNKDNTTIPVYTTKATFNSFLKQECSEEEN